MEIEFKYGIPDKDTADRILQDEFLAALEEPDSRTAVPMKVLYFDTDDGVLAANDIAFRIRKEDQNTVATLKWAGRNEGALHKREEINVPVSGDACFLIPDISVFKESKIGQEVIALINGKPLMSNVEISMLRRSFRIDDGKAMIEISVDIGEIITDKGSEPICEVELELFMGDEESLIAISKTLAERHRLIPGEKSKYARGLALIED